MTLAPLMPMYCSKNECYANEAKNRDNVCVLKSSWRIVSLLVSHWNRLDWFEIQSTICETTPSIICAPIYFFFSMVQPKSLRTRTLNQTVILPFIHCQTQNANMYTKQNEFYPSDEYTPSEREIGLMNKKLQTVHVQFCDRFEWFELLLDGQQVVVSRTKWNLIKKSEKPSFHLAWSAWRNPSANATKYLLLLVGHRANRVNQFLNFYFINFAQTEFNRYVPTIFSSAVRCQFCFIKCI